MEAGYDWLLVRSQVRRRMLKIMGFSLVGVGALFIAGSAAYYTYAARANADLKNLIVTAPAAAATVPNTTTQDQTLSSILGTTTVTSPDIANPSIIDAAPVGIVAMPSWKIMEAGLYPGETLHARYWANTMAYEPPAVQQLSLIDGFTSVDPSKAALPGTLSETTRIQVPVIGLDFKVAQLSVMDLEDSRAYETPNHIVGRIPTTANAGEAGKVWLFGHLESPLRGEGAVFSDLPQIPDMLRQGEDVYVILSNTDGMDYLYKLNASTVVGADNLTVGNNGTPDIALVTCVPRLVYDKRLVITGSLVGQRQSPAQGTTQG